MIGRLFNTLSYQANQIEKEWKSNSILRTEYAYSLLKKILFFLSKKPLKWSLAILFMFGAISLFVSQFQFFRIETVPIQLQKAELLNYFTIIWSIQTTIAALIYPIVISFISLLLQKRNDARSYLNIYLHDTAAIFSGLNALLLVLLMGVQYLFFPTANVTTVLNWIYIDTSYLLLNLVLVTYFLYQTFLYIKPASRKESLKSYLINETLPSDFIDLIKPNLFQKAADEESLLKIKELKTGSELGKNLTLETGYVYDLSDSYTEYFNTSLKNESQLLDVRFFFLKLACRSWAKKATKHESDHHTLAINIQPGQIYTGKVILCKTQGYNEISLYQKILFKLSFKFKKVKKTSSLSIEDLLQDLKAEVLRSLQSRDFQGFETSLGDLREFIVLLIKSSQTTDNNLSALRKSNFFGEAQYSKWIDTINEPIQRACQVIDESSEFIPTLILMPREILYEIDDLPDKNIKWRVILLLKKIDYEISAWWLKKIENQGVIDHSIYNPVELNLPYQTHYLDLITEFLGGWEQIKNNNILPKNIDDSTWQDLKTIHFLLKNHLATTVKLLLNGISTGNISKSKFMLDSLLKWYSSMHPILESNYGRILDPSGLINDGIIELEWSGIKDKYDFEGVRIFNEKESTVAFSIVINHTWVDYTSFFLFWLSRQYITSEDKDKSLIIDTYKRIKEGDHPLKTGSMISEQKPLSDISDVFEALLRMHYSGFSSELNYNKNINSYIRSVFDQYHISMISGRTYSGSGGESLYSMRDGILFTLLIFIRGNWSPTTKYSDMIEVWIKDDIDRVTLLKTDLKRWMSRLGEDDFNQYQDFYNDLSSNPKLTFDEAKKILMDGLKVFHLKVEDTWKNLIVKDELDKEILKKIEICCSKVVFSSIDRKFPLTLFKSVEYTDDKLSKRGLIRLLDCDRGGFTKTKLVAQRLSQDLFNETVLKNMQRDTWRKTLSVLDYSQIDLTTHEEYLKELKAFESKVLAKGGTPILLLNSSYDPDWMSLWIKGFDSDKFEKPDDLVFRKKESSDSTNSFIGMLNSTEVHVARRFVGSHNSFLLTEESFEKISFKLIEEDQVVSLNVKEGDTDTKVDLVFKWSFETELNDYPAVLLKHIEDDEKN